MTCRHNTHRPAAAATTDPTAIASRIVNVIAIETAELSRRRGNVRGRGKGREVIVGEAVERTVNGRGNIAEMMEVEVEVVDGTVIGRGGINDPVIMRVKGRT